ncbi:MAG: methyltransferase domain-containing protein [Ferrovibrio sp.]|jgi:predicted TPR repeat methyltransferase|uniref:class I SAM-dependent DNA methyltransferase n=1 Tax=Ferrovibrio sp. TaxID=1917215 RepID=UPI00391CFEE7
MSPRRPVAPAAGPSSVSDMLLGLGGVKAAVPVQPPQPEQIDRVHSALAQLRVGETMAANLAKLQQALAVNPDSEILLHQMARLQTRLDRRADALLTYRRLLALRPDHAEARHMAAVLSGQAPEKANADYIAGLFDAFADSFDEKLVGWLDYKAPQQVAGMAARLLDGRVAERSIDLGCGTGLLGPELKGLVRRLDGIDLSPRMIDKARQRNVYDELIVGEIVVGLLRRPAAYDLVLAADVLSYFGDLRALFMAVHDCLKPDGLFIATVEKGVEARYTASKTGRYQHGETYLRKRAAEAGFEMVALEEGDLRQEEGRPVRGYVFALRPQPLAPADPLAALSTDELIQGLDAPSSAILLDAARRMIGSDFAVGWALDIGGCMGRHVADLRNLAQHLDMVSADPDRSRRAFEAGLYDDCDTDATIPFLEARPDHYDLMLAADLLDREQDLPAVFSAVKIALALAGVFIAVTTACSEADLREMAKAEGLVVIAVEPVSLPDGAPALCLIAES